MKIGFITPFFSPVAGGSATVAYYLAKHLVKKGHKVLIFTSNFGRSLSRFSEEEDLIIMESKIKLNMASLLYTPSLKSKLESCNKLDILHFHNFRTYQNYVAYNYVQKTNTPYILQAHGSIPRIGKKELKWIYDVFFGYRLLRDASKVIALSKVEAEQYRRMSIPEGKIAIIPNGIDLSESAELLPKGGFKKKFNIPEDKKIILYLGRIYRIKGIDLLIRAYAYLTKKMRYKDAILVIVGPDDGYLNKVKSLAYDLEVSNSVLFTGLLYGKDKLQAFADSEVYVLPSRYETFPMTVLEAYACSKPVIASKVGGLTDLVIDGETGLLFEPENIEQLANSMLLLLNNHDKAEDLGLRGKQFVNSNFSIESVVDKLEKFYEEVVGR